jgi:hypothetical protein
VDGAAPIPWPAEIRKEKEIQHHQGKAAVVEQILSSVSENDPALAADRGLAKRKSTEKC